MFQQFREWFWKDNYWLPPGFKWQDVKNAPVSTLYMAPFIAIIFLMIRHIFERYIALNVCIYIGIVGTSKKPEVNASDTEVVTTANEKQSFRWFRKSRRYDQAAQFQKATETCWRCLVYLIFFIYGSYVVVGSHWFWEKSWMTGYITDQPFTKEMKWYYIIELSFYISLLISQFTDIKRKDFFQQFVHHLTTIILISGSFVIAHIYHGSIIMWLHDAADPWLEAAKLAKYSKKQRTCDILFVIFAVIFYLTRMVYYPFWVIRSYMTNNPSLSGPSYFNFPHLFLYGTFVLLALHYYWGYLISRMVYRFIATGKVEKDDRSDDDDDDDDDCKCK